MTVSERLFFLDPFNKRILSSRPDGSDFAVIVDGQNDVPDGITVDVAHGHIYWTNMGSDWNANTGYILRADFDGGNLTTIVPPGGTFTPKQIVLDAAGGWLYWCDREGMRVLRGRLDGSQVETLVETGQGEAARQDQRNWCVGIAVDTDRQQVYWTQKGPSKGNQGRIFRAPLELPKGASPAHRTDIELLFADLPEPIDLELDLEKRLLYWTDRGAPPRGNTVNRAPMDSVAGERAAPQILLDGFHEAIGLALDFEGNRMFVTDLSGSLYCATLEGSDKRLLLEGCGHLTGIAYAKFGA